MAQARNDDSGSVGATSDQPDGKEIIPNLNPERNELLLHGNLDIWIISAQKLPNMDHGSMMVMFGSGGTQTSDPYVSVSIAGSTVGRTFVINDCVNPTWEQHFNVPVAHHAKEVHFVVKDDDVVGSEVMGIVAIPSEQLCSGQKIEGTFPIIGKPCKKGAVLTLSIQYFPMDKIMASSMASSPDFTGVSGTYFPLRKNCHVTLYQDAHVRDGLLPKFELDGGAKYEHRGCWDDIFEAISQAQRLIYLVGWSIYHKLRLVREGQATDQVLGDLLKTKSQEGVRVLLLLWNDPTSTSILGYKSDGVMQTNDEETRRFFKNSLVQVLLSSRSAGQGHSFLKQQEAGTIYTHHQKTVIVDADAGNNKRKIVAFVGGLDLCVGRYDTQEHSLFRTLETVHKDDFHNPNFVETNTAGPREPWHDLHSRIDGPAAYDVLTNFEERWLRASEPSGIQKLTSGFQDAVIKIDKNPGIMGITDLLSQSEDANDPSRWHVQIFRSIDSNSVKGFPKKPRDAPSKNLLCGKGVLIDMSIHTAYVNAIRSAQRFIYVENQYFLGSSYNWDAHTDLGANNLIPMEIALKIASKIRSNERFAAYILIPMWPEGIPTSMTTQRILYWQNKTMQMMYDTVYKALVDAGLEKKYNPQDYLNFFCLGARETGGDEDSSSAPATPRACTRKSRRFMIYVHSKGMIADDEYVILGSANINERSMAGTRDTEIAMGAYQPHHTRVRTDSKPRGQIYGYRMSLWAEHLGTTEECFKQPESLECVRRVRVMSESNWEQYACTEVTNMKGHLMRYPVEVDDTGKVDSLPGHKKFPDVGGQIIGTFSAIQENLTI